MTPFPFLTPRSVLAWTAGLGLAAGSGCASRSVVPDGCEPGPGHGRCGRHFGARLHNLCVDNCSDIPKGAIPAPAGAHTLNYLNRQSDKAEADDFAIYYNEWTEGTTEFGPFGTTHIEQIARRLPAVSFPVVIQPVPPDERDPEGVAKSRALNAARKAAVIDLLAKANVENAKDRVVVAYPTAEGLFGEEGERIYPQMIQGGGLGGGGLGGGGLGGGGGFGGGGFGGGGFGGGGFGGGGFGGGFGR
jgi:hypothetical protein